MFNELIFKHVIFNYHMLENSSKFFKKKLIMWNLLANARNLYNYQLSVFLVFLFSTLPLGLTKLSKLAFPITLFLINIIYIILSKNILLQLQLLVFLRKTQIKKVFRVLKEMCPFNSSIFSIFFILFILFCLYILQSFFPHLSLIYNASKILFKCLIVPLFNYESLFNSTLFNHYVTEIERDFQEFSTCPKIISLINQLKIKNK